MEPTPEKPSGAENASGAEKAPGAYRTIGEVAGDLDLPPHVLRFWETRFPAVRPLKRSGNRRHYRPEDVALLRGIRELLYDRGYTIRGVQKVLKEGGLGALRATGRGEGDADDAHLAFAGAGWELGDGPPALGEGDAADEVPSGPEDGPWPAAALGPHPATPGEEVDGPDAPEPAGDTAAAPRAVTLPPRAPAAPGSVSIVRGGLRPPAPPAPSRSAAPTPRPALGGGIALALAELDAAGRLLAEALAATAPVER